MTNSAISTEASVTMESSRWERFAAPTAIIAGWVLVVAAYRFHVVASAVFLCVGWASLVLTAKLLWSSLFAAATEQELGEPSQLELGQSRRGDLAREKRALLRAIKDAEFDREMGKTSEDEAAQIIRVYRARAIEVLRELEQPPDGADPTDAAELIERELAARLGQPAGAPAAASKGGTSSGDSGAADGFTTAGESAAAAAGAARPARAAACSACQTDNDPDAVFCKLCGTRIAEAP
jgi:hypothetical protein